MERKLGEIFTYNGKIYQVVKGFSCKGCAFIKNGCCDLVNELLGPCDYTKRTDKTNVIFKEINNMEIKNNQLTIDIPEGMEIDLENSDEAFARRYNEDRNIFSCKVYITLEDFEVDSVFWHDDVLGTVYCQDKDTKEPVWIVSWGDEDGSWWEVNRVPDFYKNQFKKLEDDTKADMEG